MNTFPFVIIFKNVQIILYRSLSLFRWAAFRWAAFRWAAFRWAAFRWAAFR
jgi:hypothetical protein